jgi:hypothetical protein
MVWVPSSDGKPQRRVEDLGYERYTTVSFHWGLDFPRGPKFWLDLELMPLSGIFGTAYHDSFPRTVTDTDFMVLDLGFMPLRMWKRWGSLGLKTGLLNAGASVYVSWQTLQLENNHHFDGQVASVMPALGGEFDLLAPGGQAALRAGIMAGWATDGYCFRWEARIILFTKNRFQIRFGYEGTLFEIYDKRSQADEQRVRIGYHGVGLELGFRV